MLFNNIKFLFLAVLGIAILAMAPFNKSEMVHDHNKDIVELASETDELSILVEALEAAGLIETLKGDGPYTVFAPTNDAFNALPEGTLENLLDEANRDMLVDLLTYHVVPGKVMSNDLEDGMNAETVQGSMLTIGVTDYGVTIDDASVTSADLEASNGVVHIIDAVMRPDEHTPTTTRY